MNKKTSPFAKSASSDADVSVCLLPRLVDSWLLAGDISQHSERTIGNRRDALNKLQWFMENKGIDRCDVDSLRRFFQYVTHGHKEKGGKWGNRHAKKPASPGTVKTYHRILRAFFNWLVKEGELTASPMERIPVPVDRPDQIQPFTEEQVEQLIRATEKTLHPKRDKSLLLLLLDTGIRVSELCALTVGDVDLHGYTITINEGKGGKSRRLPFCKETRAALYASLKERDTADDSEALFLSDRGRTAGASLTDRGMLTLMKRIGKIAKVDGVRVSPHTWRHTFAISYLRAGGNVFTLKQMLGHESLAMVNRYVAVAQADVERQHRQFSPVANRKGKKKTR